MITEGAQLRRITETEREKIHSKNTACQ